MVPSHHRQLAPDVLARHGIRTPTDPEAMGAAYLHADVAADEPNPDAVARVYKQFMEAKQAKLNAESTAWLPEFVADDDDCSLGMGDTDGFDEAAALKELGMLCDAEFLGKATATKTPTPPKPTPVAVAAAQPDDLEHCRVPWGMTPRPLPADRFVAGRGLSPTGINRPRRSRHKPATTEACWAAA